MRWRSRLAAVGAVAALAIPLAATAASAQDGSDGSDGGASSFQGFLAQPPNFPFGQGGFFPPPFTEGFFGENPPPPFTEGFFADRPAPPFQAGFLPPPFAAFFGAQDDTNGDGTNGTGDGTVETQTVLDSLFGN